MRSTRAPSFRWGDADAHAQPFARVIAQPRNVHLAAITIFHVVGADAPARRVIADHAAMRFVVGISTVVGGGNAIADRAAGDRTRDRRCLAAVALADLIAERAAHDGAEHGTAHVAVVLARD